MRKSSESVQQWVDTLPSHASTATGYAKQKSIVRDLSLQSDDASSHCSSVESVLELRKPDPETVLLELGFGPSKDYSCSSRIPARFLQPSKIMPQVDINKFLEQYEASKCCGQESAPGSPARSLHK